MAAAAGGTYDDTEGLINFPLSVQGGRRRWRSSRRRRRRATGGSACARRARSTSARSPRPVGGGGHSNAAGCGGAGLARRGAPRVPRRARRGGRPRRRERSALRRSTACSSWTSRPGPTSHDVVAGGAAQLGERGSATPARWIRWPPASWRWCVGRATRLAQFLTRRREDLRGDGRLRPRDRHLRRRRRDHCRDRRSVPTPSALGRAGRGAAGAPSADAAGLLGQEDRRRAGAYAWPGATRRSTPAPVDGRRFTRLTLLGFDGAEARLRLRVSAGLLRALAGPRPGPAARHRRPPGGAAADARRARSASRTRCRWAPVATGRARIWPARSSRSSACCPTCRRLA